jgi:hypothetical protein
LIFRLYQSIGEILHGFDLGSSAVGYDGKNVYFTSLGKFCHEYSCNVIDTTRRSTTYEYRLTKYFDRGFNIVMPGLDINLLKTDYFKYNIDEVCVLPHLVFSYSNIIGNRVIVSRFHTQFKKLSDYDDESQSFDIVYYQSFQNNIRNLLRDSNHFVYVSSKIAADDFNILNHRFNISPGYITTLYDDIRKKLTSSNVNIKSLKVFFPPNIFKKIITKIIDHDDDLLQYLDSVIAEQKDLIMKKIEDLPEYRTTWLSQDPGTQISGSFNPIIENEADWYGKFYKAS